MSNSIDLNREEFLAVVGSLCTAVQGKTSDSASELYFWEGVMSPFDSRFNHNERPSEYVCEYSAGQCLGDALKKGMQEAAFCLGADLDVTINLPKPE